ncbi:hypothetical protein Q5762_22325 [Streptomyces sp. P9(2023)]|uniref:hypothetical protein n=1 Tax=Streptomyces sp. P9(2023) TaxID=3064394 RepID=UPI0028F40EE5|nr:hypothetical protein [Streptomyces sp. P9(2023)]MDT9691034.1 hypothetical protein [Streptomyces sp. P9(2023)]
MRKAGEEAKVDGDTVFQPASLSKPDASTVVAQAVGVEGWGKPIAPNLPGFRLKARHRRPHQRRPGGRG